MMDAPAPHPGPLTGAMGRPRPVAQPVSAGGGKREPPTPLPFPAPIQLARIDTTVILSAPPPPSGLPVPHVLHSSTHQPSPAPRSRPLSPHPAGKMLAKLNAPTKTAARGRAAAHGPGCPCCGAARRPVVVRASAQADQASPEARPSEGLVRIVDEAKVRGARGGGGGARGLVHQRAPCAAQRARWGCRGMPAPAPPRTPRPFLMPPSLTPHALLPARTPARCAPCTSPRPCCRRATATSACAATSTR